MANNGEIERRVPRYPDEPVQGTGRVFCTDGYLPPRVHGDDMTIFGRECGTLQVVSRPSNDLTSDSPGFTLLISPVSGRAWRLHHDGKIEPVLPSEVTKA